MNLSRYIQGIRKGSEINRLEREAMEDLFLDDALEGYDQIPGEHAIRIKRMQNKVSVQTRPSNSTLHHWSIAATVLLVIGIAGGGYLLLNRFNEPEAILVAESIVKTPDAIAVEALEKSPAAPLAGQKMQKDYVAEKEDKKPETVIIKDEAVHSKQQSELTEAAQSEKMVVEQISQKEMLQKAEKKDTTTKTSFVESKPAIPEPITGVKAYNEYLKTKLIRPTDNECKNVTGVVTLTFSIDKNGRPYNIYIAKSLCPLADWEAMRLVKEGPDWTVGESTATVNVYF